jgi:hypothetical protein
MSALGWCLVAIVCAVCVTAWAIARMGDDDR